MQRITNGCIKFAFILFNLVIGSTCMHFYKSISYKLTFSFHIYKLVHLHLLFWQSLHKTDRATFCFWSSTHTIWKDHTLIYHFIRLIKASPLYFVCSIKRVQVVFQKTSVTIFSDSRASLICLICLWHL